MRCLGLLLLVAAAAGPALAEGTWVPKVGGAPWHDRVGQWQIARLPAKYAGEKPVPQQRCGEPRTLELPAEGLKSVVIAVHAAQSADFARKLGLQATGDQLSVAPPTGAATLVYDILVYKDPPKRTEFAGATAGIILLALEAGAGGMAPAGPAPGARPEAAAKGMYVPAEGACPWHDRIGRWVMAGVPVGIAGGPQVAQQSCDNKGLALPSGDLAAVTIGVCDADLGAIPADLKARLSDTGADFTIQTPNGGAKLGYSIFVFAKPGKETPLPKFTGGVVLLSLDDASARLKGGEAGAAKPAAGGAAVLESEQEFAAQEWPFQPGERKVKMHVEVPAAGINANTGLMLVLHNWGGRYNEPHYLAWCKTFADRYNVVAASVNYLQSGGGEPTAAGEKPYDHGYLQAMDCLRALYHIQKQLKDAKIAFSPRRCYSMGGSGGGNVTLMVNKLAPRTFACVVDICGMPGLTDGIAYGTKEWGSSLNAGYSRDPKSPAFLSRDQQEIRDPGHEAHLKLQFAANPDNKVVIVHGTEDASCPVVHKIAIFRNLVAAGFRPDGHFLTPWHVDGEAVTTTGHPVGSRDKVVERFADPYLLEKGKMALQVPGPNDFERAEKVVYPTAGGQFVVDYSQGPPTIRFEKGE